MWVVSLWKEGKELLGTRARLGSGFRVVPEVFQPLVRRGKKRRRSGVLWWISEEEWVTLSLGIRWNAPSLFRDAPLLVFSSLSLLKSL